MATDETFGEKDTFLVTDLLPRDVADQTFEVLTKEVQWQTMYHHGWFLMSIYLLLNFDYLEMS